MKDLNFSLNPCKVEQTKFHTQMQALNFKRAKRSHLCNNLTYTKVTSLMSHFPLNTYHLQKHFKRHRVGIFHSFIVFTRSLRYIDLSSLPSHAKREGQSLNGQSMKPSGFTTDRNSNSCFPRWEKLL